MKKALITILGIQGGYVEDNKPIFTGEGFDFQAKYYFPEEKEQEYFNTLPLLIDRYSKKGYQIIPLYTNEAKIFNQEVLLKSKKDLTFNEKYKIKDEKNFKEIFALFNQTLDEFDEVIIDLTHGFRHLPLLMLVDLLIQNFNNTQKVKKILFAMEREKHLPNKKQRGLYEFIDLKEYLELSNIAFILSTFDENYTVANHIKAPKFNSLITALNNTSNDIMALNLNNLFKNSVPTLIKELENIKDVSISKEAKKLSETLSKTFQKKEKRYLTYYELSKNLFEKNYMLLSLALLYESIRLYIKTYLKKKYPAIVSKIEDSYNQDLYKIGDFFVKLEWRDYDKYVKEYKRVTKNDTAPISKNEYIKLQKAFPAKIKEKFKIKGEFKNLINHISHKRNNLAHANSSTVSFKHIKNDIYTLLKEFDNRIIKESSVDDLVNILNNR